MFLAFIAHPPHTREFILPASASITVGTEYHLPTETLQYKSMCDSYRLTRAKVRRMFRTYHRVTPNEMHDYYLFNGCGIQGIVKVGSSTFEWKAEPLNTMETTYPDGKWKLLGGEYSEDPAEDGS